MSVLAYPDGDIACRCCGLPIGPTSAAAKRGKECFDCTTSFGGLFSRRSTHDRRVCAKDRSAVVALYTRLCQGETFDGPVLLPSGRHITAEAPVLDAE
jgi:hypothetical protein